MIQERASIKNLRVGMKYSVDKWMNYGIGVIEIDRIDHESYNPPSWGYVKYSYYGRDNRMFGEVITINGLLQLLDAYNGRVHWTINA